jgi:hypothetical protein
VFVEEEAGGEKEKEAAEGFWSPFPRVHSTLPEFAPVGNAP